MSLVNIQKQMRKGVIELCVLTVLRKKEAYPSEIIEALKEHNFHLLEGTLYPLLTRLKKYGWIDYRWEESEVGPPRKYFMITNLGEKFYRELKSSWLELSNSVANIVNN